MIALNLTAENKQEELVKAYLEENASEELAEKINNGTLYTKDGMPLTNKKTLAGFMKYACEEARKLATKGANSACVEDSVVYGWAIHYFEEDSIEGTLYTLDGAEYKSAPKEGSKSTAKTEPKPVPEKKIEASNKDQFSFFNLSDATEKEEEPDGEEPEEEVEEVPEEQEKIEPPPVPEKPKPSPLYEQYREIENAYPDHVVAYRIGDFYEVLGEYAKPLADALDLTLTGRECGLENRVPMIGFPYHRAEEYFSRIVNAGYRLAVVESSSDIRIVSDESTVDGQTGEVLTVTEKAPATTENQNDLEKYYDPECLLRISEMLDGQITMR
jgi:hypothetical protein